MRQKSKGHFCFLCITFLLKRCTGTRKQKKVLRQLLRQRDVEKTENIYSLRKSKFRCAAVDR